MMNFKKVALKVLLILSSSLLFFSNAYMSRTQKGRRLDFRIERQRAQSKGIVVGKAD